MCSFRFVLPAVFLTAAFSQPLPDYKNRSLPVERRVADLLARMTLEEKVAQTQALWQMKSSIMDANGNFDPQKAAGTLKYGLGQVTRAGEKKGPRAMAEFTNAIQKYVMENTRLGIPVMFHEESLHGHVAPGGTHFPQAIALASSWDPALVGEVFTAVAKEVRARGAQQVLAPVLDLARDPRWGRVEETYGEDPYLVAKIASACVRAYQGGGPPFDREHVIATLKHYAAHGQPEGGTNAAPANYSERVLREQFLYPFEIAVKEARAYSVMPSYNEIDGVPSHGSKWLLEQVLREEWGFQGFTASDYVAISELETLHHVAGSQQDAAKMALEAGVDLELPDIKAYATLADQVRQGRISMATLDTTVARILRAKFLTGLFDDPYADPILAEKVTNNPQHRALARRAARESIILLRNEGNLLPLDARKIGTLAVIGPNANKVLLGEYSNDPGYFVTVLDGVKARGVKTVYAEGCRITEPGGSWSTDKVTLPKPEADRRRIAEAVKVAQQSDAILLVLGGNEEVSREAWAANHLGDMDTLDLVGMQNELAEAMLRTGKPVVVLLINGRPHSINYLATHVPAILEGWYLGQETGNAAADVLFGDYSPAGRLPVSIARNAGQLPIFYNHKPSAKRGYLFADKSPLFPFGYGLSYTTFRYGMPKVAPEHILPDGQATVTADVTNTGSREGDEVVQLYIRDDVSSVTRPVKELKGFERIHLKPGETKPIRFAVTPAELSLLDIHMERVVEPGTFTLMVGGDSVNTHSTVLTVDAKP